MFCFILILMANRDIKRNFRSSEKDKGLKIDKEDEEPIKAAIKQLQKMCAQTWVSEKYKKN